MSAQKQWNLTEIKAMALEETANAVVIADRKGRLQWHNPAFTRLTGYGFEEVVGRSLRFLKSGHHDKKFYKHLWDTILSGQTWRGELTNRRKDGTLYVEEQTITPVKGPDGQITHFIAIKNDVTDRKRQQEQLEYMATHDMLTRLPNRRVLEEGLERSIARSGEGVPAALAFLDVDNLKLINDSLGHVVGDQALKALADRLKGILRSDDLLVRLAGDEFVILLEDTKMNDADTVVDRIHRAVSERPFILGDERVYITVSIGLVPVRAGSTVKEHLARVDTAMYEAKQRGGNRITRIDDTKPYVDGDETSFTSVQRVRKYVDDQRLFFHYQPVLDLKHRQVRTYEALLRLRDENGNILTPGKFLQAAERGGFMNEIDRWVINEALSVLKAKPGLRLSINLSGYTFNDEKLIDWLTSRLKATHSEAARLGIEVTETAAIHDLGMARKCLHRLRPIVDWICLDDFGAGFNSFGYLRHLPIDCLKIDGSLVRSILHDHRHEAIVRSIQVLADGFQVVTVGEHVEDEETAQFLTDIGISYGQGFWFSKPGAILHL